MKSILLISSEFPPGPGGIGYHAYSLSFSLHKIGYNVIVMSPADFVSNSEVEDFDLDQNFKIIRYPRIGWRTYFNRWKLTKEELKRNEYSSVILTGKFSLWQGWMIKKFFPKQKTVAVLHGSEVNLKNLLLRKFTLIAINSSDIIVAVSRFTRDILPKWILRSRQIEVIPNGIFLIQNEIRDHSVLLDGSPKLITVGHVSPRKGQHRVIKALPKMLEKYPKIKYHIVGRPVNQKKLEDLAKDLGVFENIQFHGRIKNHQDLQFYYEDADIFMLLSENQDDGDVEGYGIVALEANERGLPVIGAKFCGVEDAVSHGHSGFLVDGNNIDEICSAVIDCMIHREELKVGAREWAVKHQWKEIVKQYEALIQ